MAKKSPVLLIDYDFLFFAAACVTEQKSILAINKITGEEVVYKNRTELWGRGKQIGGALEEINKSRTSPFTKEDFIIVDQKEVQEVDNAIYIFKNSIKSLCSQLDTNKYYGYTGTGETFRDRLATLQKYKGNREGTEKPTHLDALKEYAIDYHECYLVKDIEADDAISIDSYHNYNVYKKTGNLNDKLITIAVDKDAKGCTGFLFNPNKYFEPIEIDGLGYLTLDDSSKPDGWGRKWFYYQVLLGDAVDNYDPACLSTKKNGEQGCFNRLEGCNTDRECWQAIVQHYQELYPEPVTFTNFRGDELTVNWLYILQEIVDLARMLRWEGDRVQVQDILQKLRIDYDV